ncbi:GNAT family N-acetyltransferase [Sneathiella chinensis]|nr:GNAT family N-acetyltransferase [Sneathiella chinensis]
MILTLEQHALKALPALENEAYDGWVLRRAKGFTRRTNSVNVLHKSHLPIEEKIRHCEDFYRREGQSCHFRLTPLAEADTLDQELESRGYIKADPTDIRVRALSPGTISAPSGPVRLETSVTPAWREAVARLTRQDDEEIEVFQKILSASPMRPLCASVERDGDIRACGLAICDDSMMGLFEFATDPAYQRQGLGRDIVTGLLQAAAASGVTTAYLQVVAANPKGTAFWSSMGFDQTLYRYHYRSKP